MNNNINDKLELLNKAKEIYYNTGDEIMSDIEYDELEAEVGLENKNYIGSKRHNESYTVKHPVIMGSLSKVQIKEDKKTGKPAWKTYANNILSYINYYNKDNNITVIITPKYDGCSFEIHTGQNSTTISTRGDGEYGKDIKAQLTQKIFTDDVLKRLENATCEAIYYRDSVHSVITDIIFRGEVLVDKNVFRDKYADKFANPRAFVAGTLNAKYDISNKELIKQINDLECIIYDVRYCYDINGRKTEYKEFDWQYVWAKANKSYNYFNIRSLFPDLGDSKSVRTETPTMILGNLDYIYGIMDEFRSNSRFCLDGFVIKPTMMYRKNNNTEPRPKDCVAVKFMPMIKSTTVNSIEWSVGKSGELYPVLIVDPIELDGKTVTKVSAHNYGYVYNNGIVEGSLIQVSLAGDIIPFIYYVSQNVFYKLLTNKNKQNMIKEFMFLNNTDYRVSDDNIHAYINETTEEIKERVFTQRCITTGIKSLGEKNAKKLAEYYTNYLKDINLDDCVDEFFHNENNKIQAFYPLHIFECTEQSIILCFGGKTAENIYKDIERTKRDMTLAQIIRSCCFDGCGEKASEICAKMMLNEFYDATGIERNAIMWALDNNSSNYQFVMKLVHACNKTLSDYKTYNYNTDTDIKDKVYVILTGEPMNYESKSDFLSKHPEYEVTGSWKKVQKVFTNDLNSNTGKMKKAKDYIHKGYNISIELY